MDTATFAAERREILVRSDDDLRPLVEDAFDNLAAGAHDWSDDLVLSASVLWLEIYEAETGTEPTAAEITDYQERLLASLEQTAPVTEPVDPNRVNLTTVWVSTFTVNDATSTAAAGEDGASLQWVTMHDEAVRDSHVLADGQIVPVGQSFDVGGYQLAFPGDPVGPPDVWINCVVGSTEVAWPGQDVLAATRREHSGTFVEVRTADGHHLTITPNHPVLTTFGYVPAGDLRPGDRVLAAPLPVSPDVDDAPSRIEEVYRTASQLGLVRRVGPGRVDFHGDVPESEVEVVRTDGDLPLQVRGESQDRLLVRADGGQALLVGGGLGHGAGVAGELPGGPVAGGVGTAGGVRGGRVGTSLSGGQGGHTEAVRLGDGPDLQPQFLQAAGDDPSVDTEFPRHLQNALASGMSPTEVVEVEHTSGNHEVYNLHTSGNWYSANGIALHNCRCVVARVREDSEMTANLSTDVALAAAAPVAEADPADVDVEEEAPPEWDEDQMEVEVPWHGVVAPTGVKSGDRRRFAPEAMRFRDLPVPLRFQKIDAGGHDGSFIVANIENMFEEDGLIKASGRFTLSPESDEAIGLVADGMLRGVSVDLDDVTVELQNEDGSTFDLETGNPADAIETVVDGRVASAALVSIPAFQEAYISLGTWDDDLGPAAVTPVTPDEQDEECTTCAAAALVEAMTEEQREEFAAAANQTYAPGTKDGPGWVTNPEDTQRLRNYWTKGKGAAKIRWGQPGDFNRCRRQLAKYVPNPAYLAGTCANLHKVAMGIWPGQHAGKHTADTLVAAAPAFRVAGIEPTHVPPRAWFADPQFEGPTPLTVTEDGQIFGHLAQWDTCHIGLGLSVEDGPDCVTAPHSTSGYAAFLNKSILTDDGLVAVGNITMETGHAPGRLGAFPAAAHYDNTGTAAADVVAGEDAYGIWIAGAVRPGTDVQALRGATLSGDWRTIGGQYDLVAALAVNVPGFPIPRLQIAASGVHQSLVAAGVVTPTPAATIEVDVDVAKIAKGVYVEMARISGRAAKRQELSTKMRAMRRAELTAAVR